MPYRSLVLTCILSLLLLAGIGSAATAQTVISVLNPDMETGFSSGVAANWTSFWAPAGIAGSPVFFDATAVKHHNSHAQGIDLSGLATSNDPAARCHTGVYQRFAATSGRVYTASVWFYIDMPTSGATVCAVSLGIDPAGGTDPTGASVVWSPGAWNNYNSTSVAIWKQAIVTARATSGYVTVFLRSTVAPYGSITTPPHNVYFDEAYLMEHVTTTNTTFQNFGFGGTWTAPDSFMRDNYPQYWIPFGSLYGSYVNGAYYGVHMCSQTVGNPAGGATCLELYYGSGCVGPNGWGVCQPMHVTAGGWGDVYLQAKGAGTGQTRSMGIDPTGSVTIPSAQTVWVDDTTNDSTWRIFHVGPVAPVSDTVTIFLKTTGPAPDGNWYSWFDDVEYCQYGAETIVPSAVTDLKASSPQARAVNLTWTNQGDDGATGQATSLVIKYSTATITTSNWSSATTFASPPAPLFRLTSQTTTVTGLNPSTKYYFALKTVDECGNTSAISNVVNSTTLDASGQTGPITTLAASSPLSDAVKLAWNAPQSTQGGTVTRYEIRYLTQPITSGNWSAATVVITQVPPVPATPGVAQSTWVRGLVANQPYYFAIKYLDPSGAWSEVSNCPSMATTAVGSAPYWAWKEKEQLIAWYADMLSQCQTAAANVGSTATNPSNDQTWYFGGWDHDCEMQPTVGSMLQVVRDPWMISLLATVSDHVWDLGFANTPLDRNIYGGTSPHQKVPQWNESHHGGEYSWNGMSMMVLDWDNPKWLQRLVQYCGHLSHWTGHTGTGADRHLHFRSFFHEVDDWNYPAAGGPAGSLVDNPEDRRLTRAAEYAAWKDPTSVMANPDNLSQNMLISDFLYDLDSSAAGCAMKTDLGKPLGVAPGEIKFATHQIGGFSGTWFTMAVPLGGSSGTQFWDWRYGWVQSRDWYFEMVEQYLATGDRQFADPVRETLRYFSISQAVNDFAPQFMDLPPATPYPWPALNRPWADYQDIINYLYRQVTGDTQFDQAWLAYANRLLAVMPAPGGSRYERINRSTLQWYTPDGPGTVWSAGSPFFNAWMITKDKEWLSKALDEWQPSTNSFACWMEAMYTGTCTVSTNITPNQPISWNNTDKFTNFAALVLDWDFTHVKWLTYNFDAANKPMQIWLWSLRPGNYVLRHGPDLNLDDQMDSVTESIPFTYAGKRTPLSITLPAGRMEVFEIVPASTGLTTAKSLADNAPVMISGTDSVVTAVFDGCFYVEKVDRSAGMKVESLAHVDVGDAASFTGCLSTDSGERCIKALNVPISSSGNVVPAPLGITNKALGGGAQGLQAAVSDGVPAASGLSNIGLLVRLTGKVIEQGAGYIRIDDGSACYAGAAPRGVKVLTSAAPAVGAAVVVTGVSACEIPSGQASPIRLVRALAGEVRILTP